jgi:predicted RNA-binding Zn-ribbon protein involved in translation (DUF1610 family)
MITVQTCSTLPEAQVVQSHLRGSGIQAFIPDEFTVQNDWMWTNAIGGIRVQVPEQDVDRAKEILGATAMVEAAKDCPRCGTAMRQSAGLGLYPKIALALLLSLPMRSKIKWKCPQCGTIAD